MQSFSSIAYLRQGSVDQRRAHSVMERHRIMALLSAFDPLLVGTVPIDVHIETSDLDIICQARDTSLFQSCLELHFAGFDGFRLRRARIDGHLTLIANFTLEGWPLEIFGQDRPSRQQTAYRHLLVEQRLLREHGESLRRQVIALKRRGLKTEPAFAQALGLAGDPYQALLYWPARSE